MLTRKGFLLPDADEVRRRAHDRLLSMRSLRPSVEGELGYPPRVLGARRSVVALLFVIMVMSGLAASPTAKILPSPFSIVVFMCVWKRPLLTDFVLSQYSASRNRLVKDGIHLDLYLVGSDNTTTSVLAQKFGASYAIHPNSPLGAKHDKGIQSMRSFYEERVQTKKQKTVPHAVAVVGSDDVINDKFFLRVRDVMHVEPPAQHVVGLRDIHFFDLKSRRLVYTPGYRSFKTPISGTLGCGRVLSWSILEAVDWHVWDVERERGLDQSAIRNMMRRVPFVEEVSQAIAGRETGIVAVDIKSDAFAAGANIWRFEEVVEAVGKNGRLHDFVDLDMHKMLSKAFGEDFMVRLEALRAEMERLESE